MLPIDYSKAFDILKQYTDKKDSEAVCPGCGGVARWVYGPLGRVCAHIGCPKKHTDVYEEYFKKMSSTGIKHDKDKPHMNLLLQEIPNALEEVAVCLRMGEEKYGRGNWKVVENKEDRYLAALMRHLVAYHKGEKLDPESGRSHLAHVAVNALFLLDSEGK